MLFAMAIDGAPFIFRIATGSFDAQGLFSRSYTVPNNPALVGSDISFQSFGIAPVSGKAEESNLEVVAFR